MKVCIDPNLEIVVFLFGGLRSAVCDVCHHCISEINFNSNIHVRECPAISENAFVELKSQCHSNAATLLHQLDSYHFVLWDLDKNRSRFVLSLRSVSAEKCPPYVKSSLFVEAVFNETEVQTAPEFRIRILLKLQMFLMGHLRK